MTIENKKLTDFTREKKQTSIEETLSDKNNRDNSDNNKTKDNLNSNRVCDCYEEMKNKHQNTIDELGITPPKCGHCIAYLANELSEGTAATYNSSLRFFVESIHQQGVCINDVEFVHVRKYFEERKKIELSKSTINVDKNAIKGAISRYEAENKKFPEVSFKISQNIDADKYGTGDSFERKHLNSEKRRLLIKELDDIRNKLMVLTTIEAGPRADATTLIKVSDVNLKDKELKLKNTKSGGTYIMPLTDKLAAVLEHWLQNERSSYIVNENNKYLFPSRMGGKISKRAYRDIVHAAAQEAGIQKKLAEIPLTGKQRDSKKFDDDYRIKWEVDVHSLRHTFSRLLKNDNISKETRRYALDHSGDITDDYGIEEDACRDEIRNKFDGVEISIL
jgi:integrase